MVAYVINIFENRSRYGEQKMMITYALACLLGALGGFQPSSLPWMGVGVFSYLALTAKL